MKTGALHRLAFIAITLASIASGPALAQQTAPRWRPTEAIIVTAAPAKNWREVLTASHLGNAFIISASMQVPYSDLNLAREPDAAELSRRIHVAAHIICHEMDVKYPPTQYPILDGFDCENSTARDGMSQADMIVASVRH
jgi:UrcA family protein